VGTVKVIGGGLSGCEAALQIAARGIAVELWEMRPGVGTEAHETGELAELVCSNSFKSTDVSRAQGLLKEELRQLGCHLLAIADGCAIPGGAALIVDREEFSRRVTRAIEDSELISLIRGEYTGFEADSAAGETIILATGPLTSGALWEQLCAIVGSEGAYFYDATSPIITASSVDTTVAFSQSRYDKGGGDDYINCPFGKEEYLEFREALLTAEQYPLSPGDDYRLFEGCLPIEELAQRGEDTMRFGPLKPKGLTDPRTGRMPYAVVQLRWEDALRNSMSLVGFQTRLRFGEQDRVFRMIPGLQRARFTRHGRMHRNSYLDSPRVLAPTMQLRARPNVMIAGQLTGLEGYVNAMATGLWAGLAVARLAAGGELRLPPRESCLGSMLEFAVNPGHKRYLPTAFQFGMLNWLPERIRRQAKAELIQRSAREAWSRLQQEFGIPAPGEPSTAGQA
jgi:methylenetetrahydrofolate--tRNA-(uracil-5-)-methyltransferase